MQQNEIIDLHEKIYRHLLKWRKENPDFTFALRKSDLGKRLSEGYWFHGNNEYIALSFWTGMDWVRKVPNICLIIYPDSQIVKLEISVKDSAEKREAISGLFDTGFNRSNQVDFLFVIDEYRYYGNDGLLEVIDTFLNGPKLTVDRALSEEKQTFATKQNPKNRIGFISESEFNTNKKRIEKYRKAKGAANMPIGLSSIHITNFGPINDLSIGPIHDDCQWIFFTGENGTGKTSILRAITAGIFRGNIRLGPRTSIRSEYSIGLVLNKHGKKPRYRIGRPHRTEGKQEPITTGFVAFGPTRLNIWEQRGFLGSTENNPEEYFNTPYKPLFLTTGFLLDVSSVFNNKILREHPLLKDKEERLNNIIQVISTICESIVDVSFGRYMRYFEQDSEGELYKNNGSTFLDLASGYKSIIAMVSHMMLHLYYQQPDVMDTALLEGVVLIDEIDLHFHPKMQRDLVEKLTEIFPRVQFIVSTHSPIPLLGAPANSIIFTVKRNAEQGVYVEKFDNIDFSKLLPNALLTSPIFDFQEIVPNAHAEENLLITEDKYSDAIFYKILDEKLAAIKSKYDD